MSQYRVRIEISLRYFDILFLNIVAASIAAGPTTAKIVAKLSEGRADKRQESKKFRTGGKSCFGTSRHDRFTHSARVPGI